MRALVISAMSSAISSAISCIVVKDGLEARGEHMALAGIPLAFLGLMRAPLAQAFRLCVCVHVCVCVCVCVFVFE